MFDLNELYKLEARRSGGENVWELDKNMNWNLSRSRYWVPFTDGRTELLRRNSV
jgi:hypothetical protein